MNTNLSAPPDRIRSCFLGPRSEEMLLFLHEFSLGEESSAQAKPDTDHGSIRSVARDLGWITPDLSHLTPEGSAVSDSCREYVLWRRRDRALPFLGCSADLTEDDFRGRRILELGSGSGINLLSLGAIGKSLVGLEPVPLYRHMCEIFAEREGMPPPAMINGSAEDIPVADASVDIVLCVTAHQYFDLKRAMAEICRVLKPGGEMIIVGATLMSYWQHQFITAFHSIAEFKAYSITSINSISYYFSSRRLFPPRGSSTTSRPVYLPAGKMRRLARNVQLFQEKPVFAVGVDSCFRARRATATL